MRIKLTSIMVDNQEKALRFYTEVLGFKKKHDIPVGEYRWITVVSTEGPDDVELALEPNATRPARLSRKRCLRRAYHSPLSRSPTSGKNSRD